MPSWIRAAVAAGLLLVAAGASGCSSAGSTSSAPKSSEPTVCDAISVTDKVLPSVVTISATNGTAVNTGTGEVIRTDGHIVTNNHVVSIAAATGGSVSVLFSNGVRLPATITGRDPPTDLAVLKVESGGSLPAVSLGSSSTLAVGQPVVALGAPLGLANTVTTGIVSALNRTVEVPSDNGKTALLISAVQTDAAINPGNSGGALTDCAGQLIGVTTAGATIPDASGQATGGSIGLAFAIPVEVAKFVSDELISAGTVAHSYFGVELVQVSPAAAKQSGKPEGFYVAAVVPGGPAEAAGLKAGDVITQVEGKPATNPNELAAITLTKKPGETVKITYVRDGQSVETTITLAAPPP